MIPYPYESRRVKFPERFLGVEAETRGCEEEEEGVGSEFARLKAFVVDGDDD